MTNPPELAQLPIQWIWRGETKSGRVDLIGRTGRRLLYRANAIGMEEEEEDSQLVWQQSFIPLTDFLFRLFYNIVSAQ